MAAPAYVGDDLAHQRDQTRWFGGMVGNHVADIVARYGATGAVPQALTDYIEGRKGYDYAEHGRAGNTHADFVPDEVVDRFCLLGPVENHLARLEELQALGVDQFAIYLQHDAERRDARRLRQPHHPGTLTPLIAPPQPACIDTARDADALRPADPPGRNPRRQELEGCPTANA